ncbi:MAG TPA: ABC transporter ATP-binding protein [Anaerolineales bacterium]|nr:ABC transporter ATP-binding protein [Anaerolineales bacterium]
MSEPLIMLENVTRTFTVKGQTITAVDDINLTIPAGEVLCLVGESGCGKTTTGKMIAGLLPTSSGRILYRGKDITTLARRGLKDYRLGVQMVHQDPYASLNPVQTVYDILAAPLQHHRFTRGETETKRRIYQLLEIVDLTPPHDFLEKYPHQLSGGQRQRVSVARALTVLPTFIVADEAVSMVDVSIRISLLKMFTRLKDEMGVGVLLITHDLALAKYFAWEGRIGVMYLGRMVEIGPAREVVDHPQHPYTQVLLSAIPEADPDVTRSKQRIELRSMDMPSLLRLPSGCTFHPRCPFFIGEVCEKVVPLLRKGQWGSDVACHLVQPNES